MKKLITILSLVCVSSMAVAQDLPSAKIPKLNVNQASLDKIEARFKSSPNAAAVSEWYNYASAFEKNVAGKLDYSVRFVNFDTNGVVIYPTSKGIVFTHVVGQMFDPKDEVFAGESPVLDKFTSYTIDSVAFTRFYIRNLDSVKIGGNMTEVVDTMVVQYFNNSNQGIGYAGLVVPTGQNVLGYPNRDALVPATLVNTKAIKTDKILLRKADADSVVIQGADSEFFPTTSVLSPGITIARNNNGTERFNTFCYTVHFKPMVAVPLGDTVLSLVPSSQPTKKYNLLGLRTGSADGISQTNAKDNQYNNAVFNFSFLRYGGTSSNGWKSYIAGNAYDDAIQWYNFIKLSSTNASVKNPTGIANVSVYPNPAANSATLNFASKVNSTATIHITDVNGKVVKAVSTTATAGQNSINLPVSELANGIYFVNINGVAGSKFVVTK